MKRRRPSIKALYSGAIEAYGNLMHGKSRAIQIVIQASFASALLFGCLELLLPELRSDRIDTKTLRDELSRAKAYVHSVTRTLSIGRDRIGDDSTLRSYLSKGTSQRQYFQRLQQITAQQEQQITEQHNAAHLEVVNVYAIYDTSKRLLAWTNAPPLTARVDSLLTEQSYPLEKSKSLFIDRGPIFTRLISYKRIVDSKSVLRGYVVGQRVIYADLTSFLGTSQGVSHNILNEFSTNYHQQLSLEVSPSGIKPTNILQSNQTNLYADTTEPQTFIGVISQPKPEAHSIEGENAIVSYLRDLSVFLFLIIFYLLLCSHLYFTDDSSLEKRTIGYRVGMLLLITVGMRLFLWITAAGNVVFMSSIRDSSIYGFDGFSLIANPYELLVSSLCSVTFVTACYSIFFVKNTPNSTTPLSLTKYLRVKNGFTNTYLRVAAFVCILIVLPIGWAKLTDLVIDNGSFTFIFSGSIFPEGTELLIITALVIFSASYLLAYICLILFFALKRYGNKKNILFFYAFTPFIFCIPGALFSELSFLYWVCHAGVISIVACTIIYVNIISPTILENMDSRARIKHLARLPIYILCVFSLSAGLLAPVVIQTEYTKQRIDTEQDVRSKTSFQLNTLAFSFENALAQMQRMPFFTATDHRNSSEDIAFLLWLSLKKDLLDTRIVTYVVNHSGDLLSSYGQQYLLGNGVSNRNNFDSLIRSAIVASTNDTAFFTTPHVREIISAESSHPQYIGIARAGSSASSDVTSKEDSAPSSDSTFYFVVIVKKELIAESGPLFDDPRINGIFNEEHRAVSSEIIPVLGLYNDNVLERSSKPELEIPTMLTPSQSKGAFADKGIWTVTRLKEGEIHTYLKGYDKRNPTTKSDNIILSASIQVPVMGDYLSVFFFINSVALASSLILIFLSVTLQFLFYGMHKIRFRVKDRLFIIVLGLALIPLVLLTNIISTLLFNSSTHEQIEHSITQSNAIADKLVPLLDSMTGTSGLSKDINIFSSITYKHIDVFSPNGILTLSDNNALYESSFLSPILPIDAAHAILVNKKNLFTTTREVGDHGRYVVTYRHLKDNTGKSKAIISTTDAEERQILKADISRTLRSIYGIFSFVSFILLLIGSYISHKFASPIYRLISATERVASGELGTSVEIERKDEIGELSVAFNRMSTELAKSRDKIAQSEREGAWKEMARQVAHEIKNPLTPMKLSVQHVEHAFENSEANFPAIFKRVIKTLSEQIDVLTRIATEFARFGEMPRRKYTFTSLRRIVDSAVALFDSERSHVRFVIEIPESLSSIYADEEEFRRTLVNLIRNSIQAIENWGVIILAAEEKNGLIHLTLTDTGGGMSTETLEKAFDPNFSTKTSGMGLGLAIVRRTIIDMSGTISVTSEPGKGTTFHIELPAKEKQ